jgi:hypothetical protein
MKGDDTCTITMAVGGRVYEHSQHSLTAETDVMWARGSQPFHFFRCLLSAA